MQRRSLLGCFIAVVTAGCSTLAPTGDSDQPNVESEPSTGNGDSQEDEQSIATHAGVQIEDASIEFGPGSIAQIERITDQTKVHNIVEEYDKYLEGYSLDLVLTEPAQEDAATFDETQKNGTMNRYAQRKEKFVSSLVRIGRESGTIP